jgi:hypothetical protein
MATRLTLYKKNTQYIELQGLADAVTSLTITGAAIALTLVDKATLTPQASLSGVSLSDVVGTPGTYRGMVPSSFDPTPGSGYTLRVSGTYQGFDFYGETDCTVAVRKL